MSANDQINAQIPFSRGVYFENDIPYHCNLFKRRAFFYELQSEPTLNYFSNQGNTLCFEDIGGK